MAEPHAPRASGSAGPGPATVIGGRYRLVRLIARGGMAEVWEGVDDVLTRPVAIKVLLPHLAGDEAFVQRFRREAVAAARLSHPHIVALFDTCSEDGTEVIVMELVRGRTLREVLDDKGQLSPAQVVRVGTQVADALDHAHRNGLVHRDVKPGNILLSDDGRVLVADFGIAKAAEAASDLTEVGQIVGTAKYLSPEQVEGRPLDARSDVYSLGVVLYEALCGRPPFSGHNPTTTALARLTTTPLSPRQIRASVPKALDSAIMRALARDPDARQRSARQLGEALLSASPSARDLAFDDATSHGTSDPTSTAGARSAARETGDADDHPTGVVAFARQERSWIVPAVLIGIVAATLGLVGALIGRTEVGRELIEVVRPDPDPSSAEPEVSAAGGVDEGEESAGAAVVVAGRPASFDPVGGDGENDSSLPAMVDGDAATRWTTERYNSRSFGGLKDGVGVVVTLEEVAAVSRVEVDSPSVGWSAEVYVADEVPDSLSGWGEPASVTEDADGDATFDVAGRRGDHVLVWFTDLGDGSVGSRFSVSVDEVRASG